MGTGWAFIGLTQAQPVASPVLTGQVRAYQGKPTLFIGEAPVYPMLYSLTDDPGGRWTWEELPRASMASFAEQGVRLFQVDLFFETIFSEADSLNIGLVQRQIRGVLDVHPDAGVFIRLHVNASPAWRRAHPEENTAYADTVGVEKTYYNLHHRLIDDDEAAPVRTSLASARWREHATHRLTTFCRVLAKTPEARALLGIQMAGGVFGEWHYWGFNRHEPDTGLAMTTCFRDWLRVKYGTDPGLQRAWNDSRARIATAKTPDLRERTLVSDGIFRDPRRERKVIDYYECQHQVVAEDIIHFCRVAKENWPRPLITGTFYGYFFMMFGRHAAGGHLQMERILNSPYIDYLSAPMSYNGFSREIGGSGQSRGMLDACRMHNKLWLDEMDQNTHLGGLYTTVKTTLSDDVTLLRRNLAQAFTRGMGQWFYDFGPNTVTGWWSHPDLLRNIRALNRVFQSYYAKPYQSEAQVLFVYDTDVYYHLANDWSLDPVSHSAVEWASADAYHSGATLDEVHLSDLERVDWKRYKVVVFANTFYLSARQRHYIRAHVQRDGRHVVWNYMPGYTDGRTLNQAFVEELVGMKLTKHHPAEKPALVVRQKDFPAVTFDIWRAVPILEVTDRTAVPVGYLGQSERVVMAYKKLPRSTSWFCGLPLRKAPLMREIFKRAGVHLYNEQEDVIYSGNGILTVHTKDGGNRQLTLRNGKPITLTLAPRSTVLLDNQTGEILLQ